MVFVRHTLPGERVVAVVTEGDEGSRFLRADAVEVLEASPDRVEEPCPFAKPGRCGGCDWQHATLEAQRRLKSAVVQEQLARLAGLELDVPVLPVAGDEGGLRWRTRVQWSVATDGHLGLHRHRSSDVVPIDDCRIAHKDVLNIGAQQGDWSGAGAVETVASSTGERAVVVSPQMRGRSRAKGGGAGGRSHRGHQRRHGDQPSLGELPPLPEDVEVVRRDQPGPRDAGVLTELAGGRRWHVAADGFWQVHPNAAETLRSAVLKSAQPQPGETALDLYAGVGVFSAALAEGVGVTGQVWAVEGDRRAAHLAADNLSDLSQVRVLSGDVGAVLGSVAAEDEAAAASAADRGGRPVLPSRVDVVVLDPPRSGAGAEVCRAITACRPRVITYVACDPAALARDVATLSGEGYELTDIVGFDLFPMTHHVEVVVTLARRRP